MCSARVLATLAACLLVPSLALAGDEADDLLPGKIVGVKPALQFKFLAKAPDGAPFDLPDAGNDPTLFGGTIAVFDTSEDAGSDLYPLPVQVSPLGWKGLGNPAGSKGYKYKGAGTPADPCRVVLVTPGVVKAVCRGPAIELAPPFTGEVGIVVTLGSDSKRYCASFGGAESKNDVTQLKRKLAPAPASCPLPPVAPPVGIFVDTLTGSDANDGSMASPKQTIQAGIAASASGGIVYISKGTYLESIALVDGVSLYGGYDAAAAWSYDVANVVTISGGTTAVVGTSINSVTDLRDLTVVSSDAAAGGSSYGMQLTSSTGVSLARVRVESGSGGSALAGNNGSPGANGGGGGIGQPGCENSNFPCTSCAQPAGGTRGTSACASSGGAGGPPGHGTSGGTKGEDSVDGTLGGAGAPGESLDGVKGDDGVNGTPGASGLGGSDYGDALVSGYDPSDGASGGDGTHGAGGGGGGGGGGGTTDCDSYGSSGGGGGAGGCNGEPGDGGSGGGGSFGIYLHGSTLAITESLLETAGGGDGGAGGDGGSGGLAGPGGAGGPYGGSGEQDDGGDGAAGGNGGIGGRGGHGGGGGGGPSIGIVCAGGSVLTVNSLNAFTTGAGGNGGSSSGFPGAAGLSVETRGCP